jgi:hypothetical protein
MSCQDQLAFLQRYSLRGKTRTGSVGFPAKIFSKGENPKENNTAKTKMPDRTIVLFILSSA